jgi:hypothetical protein
MSQGGEVVNATPNFISRYVSRLISRNKTT